jgi:hypothetical protein
MSSGGNSHQRKTQRKAEERVVAEVEDRILRRIAGATVPPKEGSTKIQPETKKSSRLEQNLHPVPYYLLRTLSGASLSGGAAGVMIGISFWFCAGCVYLGLLLLAVDPWLEPRLRHVRFFRALISFLFVVAIFAFSLYVVFLPAPLEIDFTGDIGNYPKGEQIGNATWDCPEYCSDFRITITNPTDYDYSDVDLEVNTDMVITQQAEVSGSPCYSLGPVEKVMDVRYHDSSGQERFAKTWQTTGRTRCDKLPKHSMVQIMYEMAQESSTRPGEFADKRLPVRLKLNAGYLVRSRPRTISIEQNPIKYQGKVPLRVD